MHLPAFQVKPSVLKRRFRQPTLNYRGSLVTVYHSHRRVALFSQLPPDEKGQRRPIGNAISSAGNPTVGGTESVYVPVVKKNVIGKKASQKLVVRSVRPIVETFFCLEHYVRLPRNKINFTYVHVSRNGFFFAAGNFYRKGPAARHGRKFRRKDALFWVRRTLRAMERNNCFAVAFAVYLKRFSERNNRAVRKNFVKFHCLFPLNPLFRPYIGFRAEVRF